MWAIPAVIVVGGVATTCCALCTDIHKRQWGPSRENRPGFFPFDKKSPVIRGGAEASDYSGPHGTDRILRRSWRNASLTLVAMTIILAPRSRGPQRMAAYGRFSYRDSCSLRRIANNSHASAADVRLLRRRLLRFASSSFACAIARIRQPCACCTIAPGGGPI
jgi:hypothetical protein